MNDKLDQLTTGCMRCGNCKAVCPVLQELGAESLSPRARVRLVHGLVAGEVELSPRYREIIGKCLNCMACADECPSGILPNEVVLNARGQITLEKGLPLVKRMVFRCAMRARRMFPVGAKLMGVLQRASFIGKPWSPARLALPLMGMKLDKRIPYFDLKPFLERTPEVVPATNRKCRVAYFVGCAGNLIFPQIGEAVVGLLNHYGVEVVVPRAQICCGTPIFNSGDLVGAAYFARRNLRAFEGLGVDAIITACGSCGMSWRREWSELLGVEVPESIASKVYDIAEFLTDCLGINTPGSPESPGASPGSGPGNAVSERNLRLTYHDPCHLVRGMRVQSQPRKLLSLLPGVELVEMNEADKCCGGGGAFSLYHPDLSRRIGSHKAESMLKTGADVIVTGCPSCMMQLDEMLHRAKSPLRVAHTACLLWEGVKG